MIEKQFGKKRYVLDPELKEVADAVYNKDKTYLSGDIGNIHIEYIKVYPNISPTCAGRCVKSSKLLKFFSNPETDIVIEMSGELWDILTPGTKYILMLHELMHIAISYKKDGEMVIGLQDHDIKDFRDIIKIYGIEWVETIKSITQSIHDFQNGEEEKISI